eukprot:1735501-Amphidinium_carterae.1
MLASCIMTSLGVSGNSAGVRFPAGGIRCAGFLPNNRSNLLEDKDQIVIDFDMHKIMYFQRESNLTNSQLRHVMNCQCRGGGAKSGDKTAVRNNVLMFLYVCSF